MPRKVARKPRAVAARAAGSGSGSGSKNGESGGLATTHALMAVGALAAALIAGWVVVSGGGSAMAAGAVPHTTLRPNLYFGTRTTTKNPVMTALAWFGGEWEPPRHPSGQGRKRQLRYSCRHEDKLQRWGWTRNDGLGFGEQFVGDADAGVNLDMTFLKMDNATLDAPAAYDVATPWVLRVHGRSSDAEEAAVVGADGEAESAPDAKPGAPFSLFLHALSERGELHLAGAEEATALGASGDVVITGAGGSGGSEPFALVLLENVDNKPPANGATHHGKDKRTPRARRKAPELERSHFFGWTSPKEQQWQLDPVLEQLLDASTRTTRKWVRKQPGTKGLRPVALLPDTYQGTETPNGLVVQRAFQLPFTADVVWLPGAWTAPEAISAARRLTGLFEHRVDARRKIFDYRFEEAFGLTLAADVPAEHVSTAKAAMSNLLGGLAYFQGSSKVQDSDGSEPYMGAEHELYTAVPSRSFFPRGFLWDEGFHQLVVSRWDAGISKAVLGTWLNAMDSDGWIAREQILGSEAMSRVPEQFQTQKPDIANPPTLLLAFQELLRQHTAHAQAGSSADAEFFREAFWMLKRQYQWLLESQKGAQPNSFYWRGSTKDHCFASGLDDFPRGVVPTRRDQHVDLLSWMILAARLLEDMAPLVDQDAAPFRAQAAAMMTGLDAHWSEEHSVFCDIGLKKYPRQGRPVSVEQVCHVGYVTFFPLFLRLLPADSPRIPKMLEVLSDPAQTWSRFGIRSLSKASRFFGKGENYWRGAVWINCNYLALQALRHYARDPAASEAVRAKAATMRDELQQNVIRAIHSQYADRGFLFESYDSDSGEGRGTHPFTGWTSLVVLMLADVF